MLATVESHVLHSSSLRPSSCLWLDAWLLMDTMASRKSATICGGGREEGGGGGFVRASREGGCVVHAILTFQ